jgi:hypothetical protein
VNQKKKPIDIPAVVKVAADKITQYVGGRSASFPAPIVVIGGAGPNGPVKMLGDALQRTLHIPNIRHIHEPGELTDYLERESQPDPLFVHCGEWLSAQAQKVLMPYYKTHRRIAPRLLVVIVGVSPEELVRLRRWRGDFAQLFGARVIDFETMLAGERRQTLRVFTGHLERMAQQRKVQLEVDREAVSYLEEVLKGRGFVGNDLMLRLAERSLEHAHHTGGHRAHVTREHLCAAMPPGFDDVLKPTSGTTIN